MATKKQSTKKDEKLYTDLNDGGLTKCHGTKPRTVIESDGKEWKECKQCGFEVKNTYKPAS